MMSAFENRVKRADAKRQKRYKPVKHGGVKGFSKSEWWRRKNG